MARILLVEDDEATRSVFEAILRYDAHQVLLAANGRQALLLVREHRPDIVLSDIRMPGMTGTEFCRELRKDPDLRQTYVILSTGFDSPDVRTEGIASGADDYIGKPVRAEELQARVRIGLRIGALLKEEAELRRKVSEGEKARIETDQALGRVKKLRGDLTEALGGILDRARKLRDACLQGDAKTSLSLAEKACADLEELRSRVAPRDGP